MNREDLLKEGTSFKTLKGPRECYYKVRVKADFKKVTIVLNGAFTVKFQDKRAFPLVFADRLYFVDGADGYKMSYNNKNRYTLTIYGDGNGRPLTALRPFDGTYQYIHYDDESKLFYVCSNEKV